MFYHLFTTIQKIAPSTSTSTSTRWRVQVQVQVPRYQVQVQVQVLNLQVQVRVQVPGICTRVVLEYKYKYQVLTSLSSGEPTYGLNGLRQGDKYDLHTPLGVCPPFTFLNTYKRKLQQ